MDNTTYATRAIALEANDLPRIIERLDDKILILTLIQTLEQTKNQLNLVDQLKKQLFYGRESKYVERVRETTNLEFLDSNDTMKPYLEAVERFKEDPKLIRLLHGVVGIASETEELIEALLSGINGGELDRTNWMEEDGDVRWYLNILADVFGYTTDQVQKMNVEKLELRYKDKTTKESQFNEDGAVTRDLDSEREVLESNS